MEALSSPTCGDVWSPLEGPGVLVVDFRCGNRASWPRAVLQAVATLPAVTVAVTPQDVPPEAASFDVQLLGDAELEPLLAGQRNAPLAALSLAQLLRLGAGLRVESALIAESLAYSMLQSGPEFRAWLEQHEPRSPDTETTRPLVLIERDGDRLALTLNRPERRNAFSAAMRDALVDGLTVAIADPSIRQVVLDGAGVGFCSGGDLSEFGTFRDPVTAHAIRSLRHPGHAMAAIAARTQVRLHGACVGAGIELSAFAGHVSAAPGTTFRLPEVSMGLVPGAGGTVSISRRMGRQRTTWLAVSGVELDADRALEWGLVDAIE